MCSITDIVAELRPWEDYSVDENGRPIECIVAHDIDETFDLSCYRCNNHPELRIFEDWEEVLRHLRLEAKES